MDIMDQNISSLIWSICYSEDGFDVRHKMLTVFILTKIVFIGFSLMKHLQDNDLRTKGTSRFNKNKHAPYCDIQGDKKTNKQTKQQNKTKRKTDSYMFDSLNKILAVT